MIISDVLIYMYTRKINFVLLGNLSCNEPQGKMTGYIFKTGCVLIGV